MIKLNESNIPHDQIGTKGLNSEQHRRWEAHLRELRVSHGLALPSIKLQVWRDALSDINRWQPGLTSFQARLNLISQILIDNKMPVFCSLSEMDKDTRPDAPALRCMVRGCADERSRPFVHFVCWWKRFGFSRDFEDMWKQCAPGLKTAYRAPIWERRIKEMGLHICYEHYQRIYRSLHKENSSLPQALIYAESPENQEKTQKMKKNPKNMLINVDKCK